MSEIIRALTIELLRLRSRSQIRDWPAGEAWRIGALALAEDPEHIRLLLDAVATFHPGSSVTLITDAPLAEDTLAAGENLAEVKIGVLGESERNPAYDLLLLAHPWPWASADSLTRLAPLRQAHRRMRAARKWIYMRNLELWDGSLIARGARRVLDFAVLPLRRAMDRADDAVLREKVLPFLNSTAVPALEGPCAHTQSFPLFVRPRLIHFCPDCGMGITPPENLSLAQDIEEHYGEGFALGYHYIGAREQRRHIEEAAARAERLLDRLKFEGERGIPAETRIVLDFGCGGGRFAPLWIHRGWRYVGVDPSEHNIRAAREELARSHPGAQAEFIRGELDHPALRERAPFGGVFLSHVIEHVPDPPDLLAKLRALTAPEGFLYVETPEAGAYTWNAVHRGYRNRSHLWDFTPPMLRETVRAAGWDRIRQVTDDDPTLYPHQSLLAHHPAGRAELRPD